MNVSKVIGLLGLIVAMTTGCAASTEEGSVALALEEEGGGHGGHCEAAPIMEAGDFDGDGTIGAGDIKMISAYVEAGDYAAFFDMNADGALNGRDVSSVARRMGEAGTARDAQMARLWAAVEPYRDIRNAIADGYTPFTPDLKGHGIHWASNEHIQSWPSRGFQPDVVEGLNYTAENELVAAFYYAPAAVDLNRFYPATFPEGLYYSAIDEPMSFDGLMPHEWHNHVGACFGGATAIPGFDQCMTQPECDAVSGTLWSPKFHMLHVWLFEFNECGPFAGVDHDVSQDAPDEPNHMACELEDVVPNVI